MDVETNSDLLMNDTKYSLKEMIRQPTPLSASAASLSSKKFSSSASSMNSLKKIEESYTIQLGAQLKTTHNLRLIRCDILDYCKDRFKANSSTNTPTENTDIMDLIEPQSILAAMSLYTENLCGLVLLVDKRINSRLEQILDSNGCDFHFLSVEQQVENVLGQSSMKSSLKAGDFYLTKHSNLSQCHVLFHLISQNDTASNGENSGAGAPSEAEGESLSNGGGASNSTRHTLKQSDLSSRHPVILGLRNILKSCINHNIQTLTFPLLLTHEMTDEMVTKKKVTFIF